MGFGGLLVVMGVGDRGVYLHLVQGKGASFRDGVLRMKDEW